MAPRTSHFHTWESKMWWMNVFWVWLLFLLSRLPGTSSSDEGGVATTMPEQPIAIIIMALARSGSTLMGQLFRQNTVGAWGRTYSATAAPAPIWKERIWGLVVCHASRCSSLWFGSVHADVGQPGRQTGRPFTPVEAFTRRHHGATKMKPRKKEPESSVIAQRGAAFPCNRVRGG